MKRWTKSEKVGGVWVHTYRSEGIWVTEVTEWSTTGWADLRGTLAYASTEAAARGNHEAALDWALHHEGLL